MDWPEEEDFMVGKDEQDIITCLLQRNPVDRLGTSGPNEVKEHAFFKDVDWDGLLRQKTEFVPQLTGDDDTSYFDSEFIKLSLAV